jgi:hypothetical protein
MPLKESLRENLKLIVGSIAAGLIVVFIVAILPGLCPIFCPQETTIEGIITRNDKPVSNVNIISNGHKNLTGGDGKFVISDIQLEPGLKINIDLPPLPPIDYDSDYYVDFEPEYMLLEGLNNYKDKAIAIHFQLTEEQANKNLRLFLDTIYGTYEKGNIPYFNMKVKIKPLKGDWNEIGDYLFGENLPAKEEQDIIITNDNIGPGENIILLENNNPEGEVYYSVDFDSLRLDIIGGHTIWELGKNDRSSDEFYDPFWE